MKYTTLPLIAALMVITFTSCEGQKKSKETDGKLATEIDSVSYGIGSTIGRNLMKDGLEAINVDLLAKGIKETFEGKDTSVLSAEAAQAVITAYIQAKQAKMQEANIAKGKEFLDNNSKQSGVITLPSGLQYTIIKEGTGPKPTAEDKVSTHYHGTLIDGKVFDSSVERGEPVSFPVNGVIPGWTEALQLMPVGSKWKLFVPSNLAYGERGAGGDIGPNETLIFEVELLAIEPQ